MIKLFLIVLIYITASSVAYAQEGDDKLSKKEKRYIHPKSKYLSFSFGFGFTSTVVTDPNNFLDQGVLMSNSAYIPNIMYEHGVTSNFFAEIGYSFIRQGISYSRIVENVGGFSSYSSNYHNHDVQIGTGYRVINQNNLHFINLHAGFFFGFANAKLTDLPFQYGNNRTDIVSGLPYSIGVSINGFKAISFGPYLGVSKELWLSKDVRFFMKYIQRFGLITTMSGDFVLTSNEIEFVEEPATFAVRGGGAFITLGLKISLFNSKLN